MKSLNTTALLALLLLAACSSGSDGQPPAVNEAPSVSAIADTTTIANGASNAIGFTVSDEDTGSLAIDVTSDRQQLVPDDAIVVSGSGASRSLTLTPVADMTGDALITVVVRDSAGLADSAAFLLTVNPESRSMAQFTRDEFAATENDDPALINAIEFLQDAEDDDFADLLAD